MERIDIDNQTLKKAEQIYARRNGIKIENSKKKFYSIYKFLFQLIVLIDLAIIIIGLKNKEYIFSQEFLNNLNEFYNINISKRIEDFFMSEQVELTQEDNLNQEQNVVIQENENMVTNPEQEIPQQQSMIETIKESYSFEKPLEGTITSFFGIRETENVNINGNHTGIDISATEGTKIHSAITGNVIEVSDKGNYGKHLKIQNENIITLYAHCKKIYVNQGDIISQGQDIAEVGNTGKSTGPHLHFEIRYGDEYINPCDVINF